VQAVAEKAGMKISDIEARNPQDIETVFSATGQATNLGAILMIGDALFFSIRQRIAELSLNHRLPLIVDGPREYVLAGALMTYGANASDLFRRSATYVDKILKGAKPGDLPIEQPIKFDFVVNLKTAQAFCRESGAQVRQGGGGRLAAREAAARNHAGDRAADH
jgi:putative tryptophan/tyrosine transport system substrate-binding protein